MIVLIKKQAHVFRKCITYGDTFRWVRKWCHQHAQSERMDTFSVWCLFHFLASLRFAHSLLLARIDLETKIAYGSYAYRWLANETEHAEPTRCHQHSSWERVRCWAIRSRSFVPSTGTQVREACQWPLGYCQSLRVRKRGETEPPCTVWKWLMYVPVTAVDDYGAKD